MGTELDRCTVQVLDARIEVRSSRPVLDALLDLGVTPASGPPEHVVTIGDVSDPVGTALAELNQVAIESVGCFAVHAGVVALHGRVAAFPAASGRGKSTLTAACVQAGLGYVSDEALLLEDDLAVRPYPRAIALSPWSLERLSLAPAAPGLLERSVPPAELGSVEPAGPLRLAHLVRLRLGAATELHALPPSAGVELLLGMAFNHFRDRRRAFEVATAAASACRTWDLAVADPAEGARAVRGLLEDAGA
jgi:hypothetical protein